MDAYRVSETEADLPHLIDRAAAGEQVLITRDGQVVAELRPTTSAPPKHRSPEAAEAWRRLEELRRSLPPLPPGVSSIDLINEIREEREEAVWPSTSTRASSSP